MQRSRTLALSLDVERWLALLASHPAVRLLALDPADRFLVAQARELGMSADIENWTSADSKIRSYGPVRSLW
jgi:PIN domain nuclease of toxin-antitoxin system